MSLSSSRSLASGGCAPALPRCSIGVSSRRRRCAGSSSVVRAVSQRRRRASQRRPGCATSSREFATGSTCSSMMDRSVIRSLRCWRRIFEGCLAGPRGPLHLAVTLTRPHRARLKGPPHNLNTMMWRGPYTMMWRGPFRAASARLHFEVSSIVCGRTFLPRTANRAATSSPGRRSKRPIAAPTTPGGVIARRRHGLRSRWPTPSKGSAGI